MDMVLRYSVSGLRRRGYPAARQGRDDWQFAGDWTVLTGAAGLTVSWAGKTWESGGPDTSTPLGGLGASGCVADRPLLGRKDSGPTMLHLDAMLTYRLKTSLNRSDS